MDEQEPPRLSICISKEKLEEFSKKIEELFRKHRESRARVAEGIIANDTKCTEAIAEFANEIASKLGMSMWSFAIIPLELSADYRLIASKIIDDLGLMREKSIEKALEEDVNKLLSLSRAKAQDLKLFISKIWLYVIDRRIDLFREVVSKKLDEIKRLSMELIRDNGIPALDLEKLNLKSLGTLNYLLLNTAYEIWLIRSNVFYKTFYDKKFLQENSVEMFRSMIWAASILFEAMMNVGIVFSRYLMTDTQHGIASLLRELMGSSSRPGDSSETEVRIPLTRLLETLSLLSLIGAYILETFYLAGKIFEKSLATIVAETYRNAKDSQDLEKYNDIEQSITMLSIMARNYVWLIRMFVLNDYGLIVPPESEKYDEAIAKLSEVFPDIVLDELIEKYTCALWIKVMSKRYSG